MADVQHQKWYQRNGWRIAALIPLAVLLVLFVVRIVQARREPTTVPPAPKALPIDVRKWFRELLPLVPTPQGIQAFESGLKNAKARLAPPPPQIAIRDKQLIEHVEKARTYIQSEDQPATLWKQDELHRKLNRLGREIPILAAPKDDVESPSLASYEFRHNVIYVWPRVKDRHSEELGQAFLRFATLSLVRAEFTAYSGFDADEIEALQLDCPDLDFLFRFVAEALARRNEAIWLRRRFEKRQKPWDQLKDPLLLAALENETGTSEARRVFAVALTHEIGEIPSDHVCDPPIILSGERKGQYFFPSDIAPEILSPLLEAAR